MAFTGYIVATIAVIVVILIVFAFVFRKRIFGTHPTPPPSIAPPPPAPVLPISDIDPLADVPIQPRHVPEKPVIVLPPPPTPPAEPPYEIQSEPDTSISITTPDKSITSKTVVALVTTKPQVGATGKSVIVAPVVKVPPKQITVIHAKPTTSLTLAPKKPESSFTFKIPEKKLQPVKYPKPIVITAPASHNVAGVIVAKTSHTKKPQSITSVLRTTRNPYGTITGLVAHKHHGSGAIKVGGVVKTQPVKHNIRTYRRGGKIKVGGIVKTPTAEQAAKNAAIQQVVKAQQEMILKQTMRALHAG